SLAPWEQEQGLDVFRSLHSTTPDADLDGLLAAFEHDTEIVYHPFYLTRLASLWVRGERFSGASGYQDPLARSKYVIETFLNREVTEKWIDREGKPLLP